MSKAGQYAATGAKAGALAGAVLGGIAGIIGGPVGIIAGAALSAIGYGITGAIIGGAIGAFVKDDPKPIDVQATRTIVVPAQEYEQALAQQQTKYQDMVAAQQRSGTPTR